MSENFKKIKKLPVLIISIFVFICATISINLNMESIPVSSIQNVKVIPSGSLAGIKMSMEGVLVVGYSDVVGQDGNIYKPAEKTNIKPGDRIIKINDVVINDSKDLLNTVITSKNDTLTITYVRDGKTFEENAIIKAKAVAAACGELVLADDSGLVIDYLNGEPGIYSARYLGEDTSYSIKNAHLIQKLEGVPDDQRTARFVCVIAAAFPEGEVLTTYGEIEGRIGYQEKGTNGFGYDPIFYLPAYGKTTAELSKREKNNISHRGEALRRMKEELRKRI